MREVRLSPQGDFDNAAREYRHVTAHPLTAAMGAEITGVRLGHDLSSEAFEEIRDTLWRHKMVFLPDQHLTHSEPEAFSAPSGPFALTS